jgi:hypothetical protein
MAMKKTNAAGMARKKAKETSAQIGFLPLLAAIAAVSTAESLLAGFGIIPPILSYSPSNLFFAFLRIALVVYAGWAYAAEGAARAALRGGALFLASSLTLCLLVFAAKGIATHPILGVLVIEGELPGLFAVIVAENALVGAAIAAVAAWLSQKKVFKKIFHSSKD